MITEKYKNDRIIWCATGEINNHDEFCQKVCLQRKICDARKEKEKVEFT